MKRMILVGLLGSMSLMGQVRYNGETNKYTCIDAKYPVDQDQYDHIVKIVANLSMVGASDMQIMRAVRSINTTTAQQVLEDVFDLVK